MARSGDQLLSSDHITDQPGQPGHRFRLSGIRARLILLFFIALGPTALLLAYLATVIRGDSIEKSRDLALALARSTALEQAQMFRDTKHVLDVLASTFSHLPDLSPATCGSIVSDLTGRYPWLTVISLASADGNIVCSSRQQGNLTLNDRDLISRIIANGKFTISDRLISRLAGPPSVAAVLPLTLTGQPGGHLLLAGIAVDPLREIATKIARSAGGSVLLIDPLGDTLAFNADRSVISHPSASLAGLGGVKTIGSGEEGVIDGTLPDRINRIIGYARIADSDLRLAVAIPLDDTLATINRSLGLTTLGLALVFAVSVIGTFLLLERQVIRWVRVLQQAARRMAHGDFSETVAIPPSAGELAEFGAVFNSMGRALEGMAYLDHMTRLPNQRFLDHHLHIAAASARRSGHEVAVLFIDLDDFKPVNDAFGHGIGDQLLRLAARRLSACLRSQDLVARTGGDEFVAVLPVEAANGRALAEEIARRILAELGRPFEINSTISARIGGSIGLALWSPRHDREIEETVIAADAALYEAKRSGKNQMAFAPSRD